MGKSSLLTRFTLNEFDEATSPTIGRLLTCKKISWAVSVANSSPGLSLSYRPTTKW